MYKNKTYSSTVENCTGLKYDNASSELNAENVQDAIDELNDNKVEKSSIANNLMMSEEGYALDARQGAILLNYLSQLSNPNLLINADFQVWQRGTEFNTNVSTAFRYNADRWCHYTNIASRLIKKVDDGIYTEANLYQFLERKLEEGKPYVLSASIDGVVYAQDIVGGIEYTDISNLLVYRVGDKHDRIGVMFDESEGKTSHVVNWVKLEVGTLRTPFVPRLYGEELELCSWYYEKKCVMGCITDNTSLYTTGKIIVPFELKEKRVCPSIAFSDGVNYGYVNRYSVTTNNMKQQGRIYSTTWADKKYELISDSGSSAGTINAYIYADSEIYSANE